MKHFMFGFDDKNPEYCAGTLKAQGIDAIWNFTNTPLAVPGDVVQQKVNLAGDLAELSVRLSGRLGPDGGNE